MKNIPKTIFLQVGETDKDTDFKNLADDVTWNYERVDDTDIEYELTPNLL